MTCIFLIGRARRPFSGVSIEAILWQLRRIGGSFGFRKIYDRPFDCEALDVDSGSITIGGVDVRSMPLSPVYPIL